MFTNKLCFIIKKKGGVILLILSIKKESFMKKLTKLGIAALIMAIVFVFAACDGGGGGSNNQTNPTDPTPLTVTFTGTADGQTYSLKITQIAPNRSFAPATGHTYELPVGTKKSSGTVTSNTGGTLTLQPSDSTVEPFTAKVSGSNISDLSGTITWDDGTEAEAPGEMSPSTQTATLTITGLEKHNGKYILGFAYNFYFIDDDSFETDEYLVFASTFNWRTSSGTGALISNGSVTLNIFGVLMDRDEDDIFKLTATGSTTFNGTQERGVELFLKDAAAFDKVFYEIHSDEDNYTYLGTAWVDFENGVGSTTPDDFCD
jgi:hypothetical protein